MKLYQIFLILLTSCGQAANNTGCPGQAPQAMNGQCQTLATSPDPKQETKPSDVPPKPASKYVYSYYLNTKADMPACDMDHDKELVYIVKEKAFYACDVFTWTSVSIKGDKGDQGTQGTVGAQGTPGTVVNGNMWFDPVTGKYWLIPSSPVAVPTLAGAQGQCGVTNWRLPTEIETAASAPRGLKTTALSLSGPTSAWVKGNPGGDPNDGYYVSRPITGGAGSDVGYYCIQM